MSLAQVYTRACAGVNAPQVMVEIHLGGGLPSMSIVGLPETAVREARDRVKAALLNAGFEFPRSRVTISLAPADLPKEGSRFDLPIALGILAASSQVSAKRMAGFEFIGELSLSGTLNPVRGVLPAVLKSRQAGRGMVIPSANEPEAALANGSVHRPKEIRDTDSRDPDSPDIDSLVTDSSGTDSSGSRSLGSGSLGSESLGSTTPEAGSSGLESGCPDPPAADSESTEVLPTDDGCPDIFHAGSLLEVVAWMAGRGELQPVQQSVQEIPALTDDLSDVIGQQRARRGLEIAAAGGHNLLFCGSPGTGKTMLASRLPGILPSMNDAEALEVASIASISRSGLDITHWRTRPFRAPHHTASAIALVGGGSRPMPGEISLAHNGVLFLDELPEFSRHVLEVLREPMESGQIVISRALQTEVFPARFQLVAAMNPCPCGYRGDNSGRCHCTAEQVSRYRGRISGPLLDRIDLQIDVPRPRLFMAQPPVPPGESSQKVQQRVEFARAVQMDRQGVINAHLASAALEAQCAIGSSDRTILSNACEKYRLSPRACHRILKVARTLADLDGQSNIGTPHLAEAIALSGRTWNRHRV